jgi:AbrB family transcriptional regulator, transcriptional pleiotropic regulator of transition state genes
MVAGGPNSSGMERRVDDLGRVVLPVEMRRRLAIAPGDALDITVDGGALVLRKVEARCVFCDTDGPGLQPYRGKPVCPDCALGLAGGATFPRDNS